MAPCVLIPVLGPPCNYVGGVIMVVHFVVCWTLCLQDGSGSASPAYKMVWPQTSTLQNGVPCQLSWAFFIHNDFDSFIQSGQAFAFMLLEKLQSHFVELPPCQELSSKGSFSIAIL